MRTEERIVVKVDRLHPALSWMVEFTHAGAQAMAKMTNWAANTAQQSAAVVAVLMGPAVLSLYVFAVWSLTSEMGWTSSFPFSDGPLSSWMIWTALAICVHLSAYILKRQQKERE